MLLDSLITLAGLVMLLIGADRFVAGAGAIARNFGVSPLLIGLTIVGFATSAPEMAVSVSASMRETPNLAIGNALGSNIANIGLALGVSTAIKPMYLTNSVMLRWKAPLLLVIPFFTAILFYSGKYLSRIDGLIMLVALGVFLSWMVYAARSSPMGTEFESETRKEMHTYVAIGWFIAGFILLAAGSYVVVFGAENLALGMGVSNLFIGITIVAVATSLPEVAVSAIAAFKGENELALGNIVGSNTFNLLAVVGIAATIHPVVVEAEILYLHFPVMLAFTVALFFMAYNHRGKSHIRRREGFSLLLAFIAYYGFLVMKAF